MEGPSWTFWLKCAACGDVTQRVVATTHVVRLSSGGLAPMRCVECAALAVAPTTPPWRLSENDRRFLRGMRITAE